MVPLTMVRQVINEIAEERSKNLAFRAAVAEHEAAESKVQPLIQQASVSHSAGARAGRSGKSANSKTRPLNRKDLSFKPPSGKIPGGPPKSISSLVTWDYVKIRVATSDALSNITETNYSWNLSSNPNSSSWASLFDQWCIPMVSVTWYSREAPGSTGNVLELHTALDFDNTTTLGSLALLDDYSSSQVDLLLGNKSVTRSVRPCLKVDSVGSNGAVMARTWCDMAVQGTLWFGIRSMFAQAGTATNAVVVETTIYYAFRNPI
jgi:hypothetical protein